LTLALQRRRPDLYFLHAAAVARNGALRSSPQPQGQESRRWHWRYWRVDLFF
jgi:hypothetical protein